MAYRSHDQAVPPEERCVGIASEQDIVAARQCARELAIGLGFSPGEATVIATAVSELARNIVEYAAPGEILIRPIANGTRRGLMLVASDRGPGISDVAMAMRDGFSTAGRFGLGLPGVRRLVDDFQIVSAADAGTTVTVRKWLASSS